MRTLALSLLTALAIAGCDAKKSETAPSSAASVATESAVSYPSTCDKLGTSSRWHVDLAGYGTSEEIKVHVVGLSERLNTAGILKSIAVETKKGSFSVISVEQYATCKEAEAAGLNYEKKYSIIKIKLDTKPIGVEDIKRELALSHTSKPTVPLFVAACSTGGGPAVYRLVSDPGASHLYFTSILNQQNINATKRGTNIEVTDDSYEFTLYAVAGDAKKASFSRKTGGLLIEAHSEMVRLYGVPYDSYTCQRLDDSEHEQTLSLLKSGRQAGEEAEDERTRALKNRPNKF